MKTKVKLIDILHAPLCGAWDYICEKYGLNPWCINEGLADNETEIEIDITDAAVIGLIKIDGKSFGGI